MLHSISDITLPKLRIQSHLQCFKKMRVGIVLIPAEARATSFCLLQIRAITACIIRLCSTLQLQVHPTCKVQGVSKTMGCWIYISSSTIITNNQHLLNWQPKEKKNYGSKKAFLAPCLKWLNYFCWRVKDQNQGFGLVWGQSSGIQVNQLQQHLESGQCGHILHCINLKFPR